MRKISAGWRPVGNLNTSGIAERILGGLHAGERTRLAVFLDGLPPGTAKLELTPTRTGAAGLYRVGNVEDVEIVLRFVLDSLKELSQGFRT